MRTLIVLCAGSRMIEQKPLFLNRHPNGKLLAEKAIEGIFPELYDRIVYAILGETDEKYNAKSILLQELGERYPVEVAVLNEGTSGPADTVYKTIEYSNILGEFDVRDSLNCIKLEKRISGNFIAGLDLTKYEKEVFRVRTKSFIVINEQRQVLDVVEKKFRSDVISVGLYGFKNVNDFNLAYERLGDRNYPIKKLYLSNIISYLIGYKQRVFHCAEVLEHEDWGSPETWNTLQKKYATFFIDADQLINGTLDVSNIGELIEKLRITNKANASLVIFTKSIHISEQEILEQMVNRGIHCIGAVCGISNSCIKYIVENEEQLTNALIGV